MADTEYKAIVFDFDGVLVESVDVKTRAFAKLYERWGPEVVDNVVAYHLQHGGMSRYIKFRYYEEALLSRSLTTEREMELGTKFATMVEDAVVAAPWVEGAKDFLEQFHQRKMIFVASGTPVDELKRIIKRREMDRYFAAVYGSPATKGEILRTIIMQHGFDEKDVVMVGDAQSDYDGATQVHVNFIGRVPPGAANIFTQSVTVIPDLTTLAGHVA